MDISKIVDTLKKYLSQNFIQYKIPSGYHDISIIESDGVHININCLNLSHSYPKIVMSHQDKFINDLQNLLFNRIDILTNTESILNLKIFNTSDYLWAYNLTSSENCEELYQQLKNHRLKNVDINRYQELFDKLCNYDYNYYNDIYLENWSDSIIVDNYDNSEIIKLLLNVIEVKYENLFGLIGRGSYDLLELLIIRVVLNKQIKNYELLLQCLGCQKLVKLLLNNFLSFSDHGILIEFIRGKYPDEIFDILITNSWIKIDSYVLYTAIEYNNIQVILKIIKFGKLKITEDFLLVCRKFNRDSIYTIFYNAMTEN